jgi:agmatine/peptidylarginine deiminase
MPKRSYWLLVLLILTLVIGQNARSEEEFLPIGLTDEEMLRLDEIGMYNLRTAPPTGAVRNSSEWEPMQGVIIRYPFGISYSLIAEMSEDIRVTTIVSSASQQSTVTSNYNANGVNMANVDWLIASTNSIWTRDYGPWFIFEDDGPMAIVDPIYNRPRPQDDVIPQHLGAAWNLSVYGMSLATPGGNHMSDGLGMSMSTRLVWDENTGYTHGEIKSIIDAYLNNDYTVLEFIESGGIHHLDCWAKFLNPTTILVKDVPTGSSSHALLDARAEQLSQMISPWGRPYTVVRIYCPYGTAYTNSIILNDKVLVPTFSTSEDATALQTYRNAMPGYEVLGFTGSWLDDDAIHCRAMGVPDSNMLFVDHVPLGNSSDTLNDYRVEVRIVDHSTTGLIMDSCKIFYSLDGGAYATVPLTSTPTQYVYEGFIPAQTGVEEIRYYIQAGDNSGRVETHPFIGETWAHSFAFDIPPDMQLPVTELADSLQPESSSLVYLPVYNTGAGTLQITFNSDDSWLGFDGTSQLIATGDSLILEVAIDATGLACGDHVGTLDYVSNDMDFPDGSIAVDLHIFAPIMAVLEDWIFTVLEPDGSSQHIVLLSNNGPGRLDYNVSSQMFRGTDKDFGGPDAYGHNWVDSDEGTGVTVEWIDISTVGTAVSLGDDESTTFIPIGFTFPFYDATYTELYFSSNGTISFDGAFSSRNEVLLPHSSAPALIAVWWDDLDPRQGGDIYYYFDSANDRFIVSYDGVPFYSGTSGMGSLSFQAVLYPNGAISLNYGTMEPGTLSLEGACVGIQNSDADDGVSIAFHEVYMHDDLSIGITAQHWLSVSPAGGSVDPYGSEDLTVSLDATDLDAGQYAGQVVISSNDPGSPQHTIAVDLTVSSTFVCGDVNNNGVGPDIADLIYLVTYMFQGGPEPPIMAAAHVNGIGELDIANLIYLVQYMFQDGPEPICP